jgi:hypothetical protein
MWPEPLVHIVARTGVMVAKDSEIGTYEIILIFENSIELLRFAGLKFII